MSGNFNGRSTSLCYLERGGKYLILHRTKKEHDENGDKWIGVGGKFEPGETPDECALREVKEETGLTMTDFRLRVYMELLKVPPGTTVTYGELARRLDCGSAQAVGQALRHNPFAPEIPCHRVVAADGSFGGYGGSRSPTAVARKRKLLEAERQARAEVKGEGS